MKSIYRALAELEASGQAGVVCTIMNSAGSVPRHTGSKMLVYPDGRILGSIGGGEVEGRVIREALEALQEGKNRVLSYKMSNPKEGDPGICGGQLEILVEPLIPQATVVVLGGGHVGKAVGHLAGWLGFRVVVSDDRPEWCTAEVHPEADELICAPIAELPERLVITAHTYLVLTTRGIDLDVDSLPKLIRSPAAYIGVIGSKRRWITTRKRMLAETDIREEELKRVHSPIGLELNAETPEEIAVSIMAEIILLRNGGSGKSMKL